MLIAKRPLTVALYVRGGGLCLTDFIQVIQACFSQVQLSQRPAGHAMGWELFGKLHSKKRGRMNEIL